MTENDTIEPIKASLTMIPPETTRTVIDALLSRPEQTTTVVVALVAGIFNYQKTGKIPLGRIPYKILRETIRDLGDQYFGTDRPYGVPGLITTAEQAKLDDALRTRHYESGDLSSYEYAGERLNLRRPSGTLRQPGSGDLIPMETHVRSFELDDGRRLLIAHDEANRFEATTDHVNETVMSWERGRRKVKADLDDADIDYQLIQSEANADVSVID